MQESGEQGGARAGANGIALGMGVMALVKAVCSTWNLERLDGRRGKCSASCSAGVGCGIGMSGCSTGTAGGCEGRGRCSAGIGWGCGVRM